MARSMAAGLMCFAGPVRDLPLFLWSLQECSQHWTVLSSLGAFVSQNPTTPSHLESSPIVRIIAAAAAHTGPEPAENTLEPSRPGALLL
ncbi:hypothetical protein H4R99_008775, partial [Coemansia sp. RSA 1722]